MSSGDLIADSAPTYAVVDKKSKAKKKAPQKPERADPAMEMYSVIDNSKKTRSASGKPLTGGVDGGDEAPTYDMIDRQSGGPEPSASAYSRFDRTDIPSKTPQVATIPAKKEDSPKKKCTGVVLASVVLFVLLSVILVVLLIALVVAFIQIVNLQSRLNTLKDSSSVTMPTTDTATGSPLVSNTDALNANLTMLQMNFEMLKRNVNSLFDNLTNETTTDINERKDMLDSIALVFYSALNTLEVIVPGNLTEIEANASRRLDEIVMNVTSTLMTLQNNFTAEISSINTDVQDRLNNIELVANQTILQRASST